MHPKRRVLALLTHDELAELARRHQMLTGSRTRKHLAHTLEQEGPSLPRLLAGFELPRLQEICRSLGLETDGQKKSVLLVRLGFTPEVRPPATAGSRVQEKISLLATHPELAWQWHPSLNGRLGPADVSAKSRTVVWWICDAVSPHIWQASVGARARSGSGCASCARPKKKLLRDHHPALAAQFHPTKNLPLVLDEIGIGTEKRIWWRCEKVPSHEWDALIACRIKQPSCPLCTGRILTPETSLLSQFPDIAKEWHPTRNGALRPVDVSPASVKRRWWRCTRNPAHEWEVSVGVRTRNGTRCPVCFGSFLSPEVAFSATHPALAREWHPTLNGDLRPDQMRAGSDRKVFWQCARDSTHVWRVSVANRSSGSGCPMCSGRIATPATSLLALHPEVAARWHPTRNGAVTPDQIKSNAKKKYWWACSKEPGHEWQAAPKGMGRCPICVGKKVIFSSSLAGDAPAIAAEWHPTRNGARGPADFYRYSVVRVWWRCARDPSHEWENTIGARVKHGSGCPICGGRAPGPNRSLAALHPEIAKEWHPEKNAPLTPHEVVPGAGARVWWRCQHGHEWQTRVYERTVKGCGCRQCFLVRHRVWLAENNRARARQP